jgi:hypothetical protein
VSQNGSGIAQFVFAVHCTHLCAASQTGVKPAHCMLLEHCTHRPLVVSQIGASGLGHIALPVQAATHALVRGSQSGVAPPQSVFARQATQRL